MNKRDRAKRKRQKRQLDIHNAMYEVKREEIDSTWLVMKLFFTGSISGVLIFFHPKAWKLKKIALLQIGKIGLTNLARISLASLVALLGILLVYAKYKVVKSRQTALVSFKGRTTFNRNPIAKDVIIHSEEVTKISCVKKVKNDKNEISLILKIYKFDSERPIVIKYKETKLVSDKIIGACRKFVTNMVNVRTEN